MLIRRSAPLGLILLWFAFLLPSALCVCYEPDGQLHTDYAMQPCPNSGLETICCAMNRTNYPGGDPANGGTRDECLPNGLCANSELRDGQIKTAFWRGFCTEQDWASGKCLNVCTDGDFVKQWGNRQITPCDGTNSSTKWCCGETSDCCALPDNNSNVIHIAQTFGTTIATSSTSPTASSGSATKQMASTSAIPTSSAILPTSTPNKGDNGGLSTGAKAGIGIGATVGAFILLGLGFFIAKSLQWKKKAESVGTTGDQGINPSTYPNTPPPTFSFGDSVYAYHQMPEPVMRHELPASKEARELPIAKDVKELPTAKEIRELSTGKNAR